MKTMRQMLPHRMPRSAFTLVELLVVMCILTILAAISIPAINSVMTSYGLSSTSQTVLGQLNFARQQALANNAAVQVRFYKIADYKGTPVYRAVQVFQESLADNNVLTITPITRPYFFPAGLWIVYSASNTAPSTLFTTATSGANTSTGDAAHPLPPPYGASPYVYFRFRPTGQTDLLASSLVTIASENARIVANNLPANFITLQIDPVNGYVRAYQP